MKKIKIITNSKSKRILKASNLKLTKKTTFLNLTLKTIKWKGFKKALLQAIKLKFLKKLNLKTVNLASRKSSWDWLVFIVNIYKKIKLKEQQYRFLKVRNKAKNPKDTKDITWLEWEIFSLKKLLQNKKLN